MASKNAHQKAIPSRVYVERIGEPSCPHVADIAKVNGVRSVIIVEMRETLDGKYGQTMSISRTELTSTYGIPNSLIGI